MKKAISRIFTVILCAAALCVSMVPAVSAKIPSPSRYFYVYDEANVLSLTTEDHIISVNETLSAQCGAQVVIACLKTTGNSDIADFTYKMFNKWEIGDKDKKNGVLVLLAVNDGDYYALQGKGLENLLSSGTLKLMLDQYLEPYFSVGDYDAGAAAIFDQLVTFLSQIYSVNVGVPTTAQDEPSYTYQQDSFSDEQEILNLFEDGFSEIGSLGSTFGSIFSGIFTNFPLFQIIGNFFKSLSFSKIILIIVVILLIRSLFGKRRRGGGGSSRGGGGGR